MTDDTIPYPTCNRRGWIDAAEGDGLVMSRPFRARGTVQRGKAPTLTSTTGCGTGVVVRGADGRLRIRYLTPLECWRLMGQPDWAYWKAADAGVSRNQLYRQAGNSIVVDCLEVIFRGMYLEDSWERSVSGLEGWS